MFINKVMVYGNLTRDPELRQLPSGTNIANVGIATNRYYNNQQGERQEETEFHNVVLFGRLADLAQQYLTKGGGVFIEGRLRTSSWDDKETGQKRYRTEIIGEQMQFGPRRNGGGATGQGQQAAPSPQQQGSSAPVANAPVANAPATPPKTPNYPEATINPDDIPF
ncbi:MAG: single-stranded DNA-binding protein [Candidatus Kaiserbacteria bacterium]|nr:single-stranded DNA-binding protein [Candidatus Kaiserbacteria bacterium]